MHAETPLILLKSAALETEGHSRTLQVIKACKMITDTLPFDRKNFILLEEPELMTYLMACFPLNPRSIDMIVYSMIEKFQTMHTFMKEIWMGFLFIANLPESEANQLRKTDSSSRVYQFGIKKLATMQTREFDDLTPSRVKRDMYCKEIERNKELIKLATLNYVDKVIELYLYKLRNKIAFHPDIPFLLKAFLTHTPSDKVIMKACTIIEKVRRKDPKIPFDHEIEEIIVSKKLVLTNLLPPQSRNNVESMQTTSQMGLKPTRTESLGIKAKPPSSTNIAAKSKNKIGSLPNVTIVENEPLEKPMTRNEYGSKTSHNESGDMDELDVQVMESEIEMLDEWLCEYEAKEVPIVAKDENIKDLILKKRNLEAFLSFVLDPRSYSLSHKWRMLHNEEIDTYREEENNLTQHTDSAHLNTKLQQLKNSKSIHPYILRSFKVMQVLCDIRNFKYIMQAQKEGLETFFTNMYVFCVAREEGTVCNFNHIARIAEFFLRKEPNGSIHFLMRFNLIFKFLQNMVFQYVQHFFLTLFGCSEHFKDVDQESINNVLGYCKITSFFDDMAQAILFGESTLDPKKFDVEYKPLGIGPILQATSSDNPFYFTPDERPTSYDPNLEEPYFIEDTKGFVVDIDNLQDVLKARKNVDFRKLRSLKTFLQPTHSMSPVSRRAFKRYPSLMEKQYSNTLNTSKLEGQAEQTSFDGGQHFIPKRNSILLSSKGKHRKNSRSTVTYYDASKTVSIDGKTGSTLEVPNQDVNNFTIHEISGSQRKLQNFILQAPARNSVSFTNSKVSTTASPNATNIMRTAEKKINLPHIEAVLERSHTRESHHDSTVRSKQSQSEGPTRRGSKFDLKRMESGSDEIRLDSRGTQTRFSKGSFTKLKDQYDQSQSTENKAPQKITLAQEMMTDTIGRSGLEQLNKLYPLSTKDTVVADIDFESKRSDFNAEKIKANEPFALATCEMLEEMFRRAFKPSPAHQRDEALKDQDNKEKKKYEQTRNIGANFLDYTLFWDTILDRECRFFESILKNYLLKIKISPLASMNSGFVSGKIVNMVLQKCIEKNPYLENYSKQILAISKKHFHFLCKMIIQSHAWESSENVRVFLQDMEINDLLGSGRLLLAQTLNLIIQNNREDNYIMVQYINDTCWHTLLTWFFTKKTNNLYQQVFFKILETALLFTDEKFISNLLFKLNIVSYIYNVWTEICQNNVLLKDNHIDSMHYYIKKLYNLIFDIAESRHEYTSMQAQLASSISWNALEPHLLNPLKRRPVSVLSTHAKIKSQHDRGPKRSILVATSPKAGMRTTSIKTIGSNDFTSHLVSPPSFGKRNSPIRTITFNK